MGRIFLLTRSEIFGSRQAAGKKPTKQTMLHNPSSSFLIIPFGFYLSPFPGNWVFIVQSQR
jgi:hypothetical protein